MFCLYNFSYYAKEERRKAPRQQALREKVLKSVPLEACYLSPGEDDLVKRMLRGGGEAYLDDWDEISAAEALISRLWCTLQMVDGEYARRVSFVFDLLCLWRTVRSVPAGEGVQEGGPHGPKGTGKG